MRAWVLEPAACLARALQDRVPPRWRGLDRLGPDRLDQAMPGRGVQLVLPDSLLLRQSLDPPQAGGALPPGWLEARIEALSPWEREACLWALHRRGGGLELALIPARPVQEAEAALTARGARLAEVVAGAHVFRRDGPQERRWRDRLVLGVLALTLAGLGLAGLGLHLGLQAQERAALAQTSLARSLARIQAGAAPAAAALDLVPRKGQSLALALARLAAALPEDSFLTGLAVVGPSFDISGQSARPEAIIPALSAETAFSAVDFAGPAARNPDSGGYSFTIHGTWSPQ